MEAYPYATMLTSVWPRSGAFSRNLEVGATHDVQPAMTERNLISSGSSVPGTAGLIRTGFVATFLQSPTTTDPRLTWVARHCVNFTQRAAAQHVVLPLAVYVCLP